jgi:hypothetical protein
MQVKREEDNRGFTLITVKPWPDEPWGACVRVLHEKRDDNWREISRVLVCYGQTNVLAQTAREFAQAILRACDIAEQLEKDGRIILEGEGEACAECGVQHLPGQNTLCSA